MLKSMLFGTAAAFATLVSFGFAVLPAVTADSGLIASVSRPAGVLHA